MKITTRKKHAVLASLVLVLGLAVLANWYLTEPEQNNIAQVMGESDVDSDNVDSQNLGDAIYVNTTDINDEYFASAKLSRDNSYDEAVATLKEIINGSESDSDSVKTATDAITVISQRKIEQTNIENLVEAKTGSRCVAVISDNGVEVIVEEKSISDDVILQIKDIVISNTSFSQEKISIITAK